MTTTVLIRDEAATGQTVNEFSLEFLTETIDVRELIRSRVYQEVKDHNAKQNQSVFKGLIQPTDTERTMNGYRLKKPRQIDWKQQFEMAIEAFEKNQILILINNRQADSLNQQLEIGLETVVSFIRLTPLVGG